MSDIGLSNQCLSIQQSGAAEACWAHNPEVDGSKPSSATYPSVIVEWLVLHVVAVATLVRIQVTADVAFTGLSDAKLFCC
ncbi:unnamed protein product [Clavelina lepadiformis]|uniref:Uncharacterized protein n=1 Tax=Clavelina lepadiformis TaxID=159417 RepID=A0ABP0FVZ8_CLALP